MNHQMAVNNRRFTVYGGSEDPSKIGGEYHSWELAFPVMELEYNASA